MIGSSLRYLNRSRWQRAYLRVFGIPHLSMHIKAQALSPLLPIGANLQVLDAGCGHGLFSFWLAQQMPGSAIVGMDISEDEIDYARQMVLTSQLHNLSFHRTDLRDLSQYRENFDLILCLDVLEHIVEDEKVLMSLNEALKSDGQLIIHVPRRHQDQHRFFGSWVHWADHGHVRDEYTQDEIRARLINANFKIIQFKTTFRPAQSPFWEISSKLRQSKLHLNWLFFPFLLVGSSLGGFINSEQGNGLLLLCKKAEIP